MDRSDFPEVSLPSSTDSTISDDVGAVQHDQLPSVEAYKAQQGTGQGGHDAKRQKKVILAAILTFIMLLIVFCTAVATGNKKRKNLTTPANSNHETKPSTSRKSRVDSVIKLVTKRMSWSDPSAFDSQETPQYKAAKWIADIDERNIPVSNVEEFRSRYALAVFYYATNGDRWAHDISWMSAKSHCEWDALYPGKTGKKVRVGVECFGTQTVTKIFLPSMALKGTLPMELRHLRSLKEFDVSHNDIVGPIPDEYQHLVAMESFILHHNSLKEIPSWMHKWSKLKTIDFANNKLKGSLPDFFGNFTELTSINLEHNSLTGGLEPLKKSKKLTYIALGDNEFEGTFTNDYLASWFAVKNLDLSDNRLNGRLPNGIFQLDNLKVLDLHGNNFTGHLPLHDEVNTELEFLALHDNELDGQIDEKIANLVKLKHLDLSGNKFTGDIPHELSTLTRLKYLFLAFNRNLNAGPIPVQFATMDNLQDLSLQATNRNDKIPREFHLLSNLVMLDLIENSLTGTIPSELANIQELKYLLLKQNALTGTIPPEFAKLKKLDTFLVEQNHITGGAQSICSAEPLLVRKFVSDCSQTGCTCCTKCCEDTNPKCNDLVWFAQQDPVSNYLYERVSYRFNEEDVIFPIPEMTEITDFYDTFGMSPEKHPFQSDDSLNPFTDNVP